MTVSIVDDFTALVRSPFGGGVNAFVLKRGISGDFNALARRMQSDLPFMATYQQKDKLLRAIARRPRDTVFPAAIQIMSDIKMFSERGAAVYLRFIESTATAETGEQVCFHADTVDERAGRILCCYNSPTTEWVAYEDARKTDGAYYANGDDVVRRFEPGHLWRFAGRGNVAHVQPLLHRSPATEKGDTPRLFLVVDKYRGTGLKP